MPRLSLSAITHRRRCIGKQLSLSLCEAVWLSGSEALHVKALGVQFPKPHFVFVVFYIVHRHSGYEEVTVTIVMIMRIIRTGIRMPTVAVDVVVVIGRCPMSI